MSIYGPFSTDGSVLVGVIGTKEHAKEISDTLSSMYRECVFLERVRIVPPKKNATPDELLSAAADSEKEGKKPMLWAVCAMPRTKPAKWPSECVFLTDYLSDKEREVTDLPFVPRKTSLDEALSMFVAPAVAACAAEDAEREIQKLRAEKLKQCKRADQLETELSSTKNAMNGMADSWNRRSKGSRISAIVSMFIAAAACAFFAFGVRNPNAAFTVFEHVGAFFEKTESVVDESIPSVSETNGEETRTTAPRLEISKGVFVSPEILEELLDETREEETPQGTVETVRLDEADSNADTESNSHPEKK